MKYDKLLEELGFSYCHVSDESLQYLIAPDSTNWLSIIPKELRIIVQNILQNELIFKPRCSDDFKYIIHNEKPSIHILFHKPDKLYAILSGSSMYEYLNNGDPSDGIDFVFSSLLFETTYKSDYDRTIEFSFNKKLEIVFSSSETDGEDRYDFCMDDVIVYFLIDNRNPSSEAGKQLRKMIYNMNKSRWISKN